MFQSGVMILERRDVRGRVCLVSQRGERKSPWFQVYLIFIFKLYPAFIVQLVSISRMITLAGPFIVYMLRDIDILEDWTAIKKVKKMSTF